MKILKQKKMRILVLPSFYPADSNLNLGLFFKEQVNTLAQLNINVTYVQQNSLSKLNYENLQKNYYQSTLNDEGSWKEFIVKSWKIPRRFGYKIGVYLFEKLVEKYIKKNRKPDLIHVHNVYLAGVAAFFMRSAIGICSRNIILTDAH